MISDFWLASPFPRSQLFEPTSNRCDNSQSSPSNTSLHLQESQAKDLVLPPLILPQQHQQQLSFMNSNWNFQNEFEKDFDYEGWFNNVTAPSWNLDVVSDVDNYWNCNDVEEIGNNNSSLEGSVSNYNRAEKACTPSPSSPVAFDKNVRVFDNLNSFYGLPSSTNLNSKVSEPYDTNYTTSNLSNPALKIGCSSQSNNLLLPLPQSDIHPSNSCLNSNKYPEVLPSDRFPQLSQLSPYLTSTPAYSNYNQPLAAFTDPFGQRLNLSCNSGLPYSLSQLLQGPLSSEIQSPFFDSNHFGSEYNFNSCEFSPLASTVAPFSPNEERDTFVKESLVGNLNLESSSEKETSRKIRKVPESTTEDIKMFGKYREMVDVYDEEGNIVDLQLFTSTKSFTYSELVDTFICYRRNHLALTSSIVLPQSTRSFYLSLNSANSSGNRFRKISALEVELSTSTPALNYKKKDKSMKIIDGARLIQFDKTRKLASAMDVEAIRFDLDPIIEDRETKNNRIVTSHTTKSNNIIHDETEEEKSTTLTANWNRIQFSRATINNTTSDKNDRVIDYYRITVILYAILEPEIRTSEVEGDGKPKFERIQIGSCRGSKIIVRGRNPKDFKEKDSEMKKGLGGGEEGENRRASESGFDDDSNQSKTSKRTRNVLGGNSVGSSSSGSRKIRKL